MSKTPKTVFITGASGYLGSTLVEELSNSYHVVGFGTEVNSKEFLQKFPDITYIEGDIRDKETLKKALINVDFVKS